MLRGIFFQHTQKEDENLHNNVYCAGGRMCARENTPHYLQKRHNGKTTPCLHQNNGIFSLKIHLLFLKLQHIFFRVMKRLIISNDGNT
jgi:hypothetical protein